MQRASEQAICGDSGTTLWPAPAMQGGSTELAGSINPPLGCARGGLVALFTPK